MHKPLKCADDIKQRPFTPQAHQLRVTKEFLETNKRGLLFWHQLGSGKTCACYMAVDEYRKKKEKKKVFIIAPAALASTHRDQYCTFCGANPNEFFRDFHFYSYNDRAGITKKMSTVNLDDSIIILDEVQDIINGKGNYSPTLSAVYDKVLRASRSKVIILSATPSYNEFGFALLFNLLEPGLFPIIESEFLEAIRNREYLYEKLKGLISYVPVPNPELYPVRVTPDVLDVIPMSAFQFLQYKTVRDHEIEQVKIKNDQIANAIRVGKRKQADKLKALQFIQISKLKSRQLCNFAYPEELSDSLKESPDEDEEKNQVDILGPDNDLNADWILNDPEDTHIKKMKEYSPKMAKLIHRLLTFPGKHMVYGWFKTKYGLNLMYTYLKHCGLESLIFSGDLSSDDKRAKLINQFNHEDNKRGEKYKVIFVSGAGAMGISLFGIRHIHIFEASLNEFITVQAEGRAFRTMSHHQLPPEERNVQVYRYLTTLPKDQAHYEDGLSTEQQIHQLGMNKLRAVEAIMEIMKRSAFDCREPYNHAIKDCHDYDLPPIVQKDDYDFHDNPYDEAAEVFEV